MFFANCDLLYGHVTGYNLSNKKVTVVFKATVT